MSLFQEGVVKHLQWRGDSLRFLDQTLLPNQEDFVETSDYRVVCDAVRRLAIRGAPAIGVAGGYALALGAQSIENESMNAFTRKLSKIKEEIASSRPTAVNLFWALRRLMDTVENEISVKSAVEKIVFEAERIQEEDIRMCRELSRIGKELIPDHGGVMTYCNAGGLATGGFGTALGVIFTAHREGKEFRVLVNETRPLLQGARLTSWELKESGIPFVLMTDNMAAQAFLRGDARCVIVGADRIARNGDTANKVGTYSLAVLAKHHDVPFYVAAPTSTIDMHMDSGDTIPIEERGAEEVTHAMGSPVAPSGIEVMTPAFDITPSHLITAIITEQGICRAPYQECFQGIL